MRFYYRGFCPGNGSLETDPPAPDKQDLLPGGFFKPSFPDIVTELSDSDYLMIIIIDLVNEPAAKGILLGGRRREIGAGLITLGRAGGRSWGGARTRT